MTEEIKQAPKVSEMLRITANNTIGLMARIADHIDELEAAIEKLKTRVEELEGKQSDAKS